MTHTVEVSSPALQQGAGVLDAIGSESATSASKIQGALDVANFSLVVGVNALQDLQSKLTAQIGAMMRLAQRLQARADHASDLDWIDLTLVHAISDGFKAADLYAEANRAYRRVDVFNALLGKVNEAIVQLRSARDAFKPVTDANVGGVVAAGAFYAVSWANVLRDFDVALQAADNDAAAEDLFIKRTWFPALPASVTDDVVLTDAYRNSGVWGVARQVAVQLHGGEPTNAQINAVFQQILAANGLTVASATGLPTGTRLTIPPGIRGVLGTIPGAQIAIDGLQRIPDVVDNFTGNLDQIVGDAIGGANGTGAAAGVAAVVIAVGGGVAAGAVGGGGAGAGAGGGTTIAGELPAATAGQVGSGATGSATAGGAGAAGGGGGGGAAAGSAGASSAGAGSAGAGATGSAGAGSAGAGATGSAGAGSAGAGSAGAGATGSAGAGSAGAGSAGASGAASAARTITDASGNIYQLTADGWKLVGGPYANVHGASSVAGAAAP